MLTPIKFELTFAFLLFCSLSVFATETVKNGTFLDGGNFWNGEGEVIKVNEEGQTVSEGGFPVLELTATKSSFVSSEQAIKFDPGVTKCVITVIAKKFPDFRSNKESPKFTKNLGPGSWKWSSIAFPKADFYVRLQDGWYYFQAMDFPSGNDWQTITLNIDGLTPQGYKKLSLILSPGEGNVIIRSVAVTETSH